MTRHIDNQCPTKDARREDRNEFFRKESPRLLAAVKRKYPRLRRQDVEEVIQTAFLADQLHQQKNGPFPSDQSEHHWLLSAVYHGAIDWLRRHKQRETQALDDRSAEQIEGKLSISARSCLMREAREWFYAKVVQLTKEQPENLWFLLAHYWRGMSLEALAAQAGLTRHAVECRNSRLIAMLRQWKLAECPTGDELP